MVKMQALLSHFLMEDEELCVVASWSRAFFGVCDFGCTHFFILLNLERRNKMKKVLLLVLALIMCLSICACDNENGTSSNDNQVAFDIQNSQQNIETSNTDEADDNHEKTIPNNGEWDRILCSGDSFHLVIKEIDAYDGYTIMLCVENDDGKWVQEITDTGTFIKNIQFRATGNSDIMYDSSCYMYLGEGVFLASPGVSVFTKNKEYRVGPWSNYGYTYTGKPDIEIWECLIWNVNDNTQVKFDASKLSVFQDGYLLFCEEDKFGGGMLCAMNTKGEITELPCEFLPNIPGHNFPVYSEGLFFARGEHGAGFFDISGNEIINLFDYNMGRIAYSAALNINAPYFENGNATILFKNNGGSVFKAIIDKTGAFIGEPEKVDVLVY